MGRMLESEDWPKAGKADVASVERELRAALIEKMILDFDYLPLPAQLAN